MASVRDVTNWQWHYVSLKMSGIAHNEYHLQGCSLNKRLGNLPKLPMNPGRLCTSVASAFASGIMIRCTLYPAQRQYYMDHTSCVKIVSAVLSQRLRAFDTDV